MSWLKWIKTAANVSTGGVSSLYLYGGLLAAGAALSAVAMLWHGWQVDGVHDAAFKAGQAEVRGESLAAENRALLIQREQIITLSTDLMEAQRVHAQTSQALAAALARAAAAGQRVRSAAAGDELDQRIGAAECSVARSFGARAFRAAAACRDDAAALGLGTGGLVESAASAHYEHARAEALSKLRMPKGPFTTTLEHQP